MFYYDTKKAITTNAAAGTLSTHFRWLTVANQALARFMAISGAARFGTAGGAILRLIIAGTAGTGGTAQTPIPRYNRYPAAEITAFDDTSAITAGATPVTRASIGVAQTGGHGAEVPLEFDMAITLSANGGANGNAELASIANAASVLIDATVAHREG